MDGCIKMNKKLYKDKRNLKYGTFAVVITVLVIIAVLALNILAGYIEENNGLKVDFTPQRAYTLDKNAQTAIQDLDRNVVIYTFIPSSQASNYSNITKNIAELFAGASDKVEYINVDPVINPSKLKQFSTDTKQLTSYCVVIAQKDNEENFQAFNESELVEYNSNTGKNYFVLQRWLTSALINLRTELKPNVLVLTGHGEKIDDNAEIMFERIRRENFNVEQISLASGETKLSSGDILLILEPNSDLSATEYDAIISFLGDNYGRALFLASRLVDDSGAPLKNYTNLLDYFNLSLTDGVVAETSQSHRSATSEKIIELVADQSHEISKSVRSANAPVWAKETGSFEYKYGTGTTLGNYQETFSGILTSYASSILVPWDRASNFNANDYKTGVNTVACAYQRQNIGITGTTATTTTRILLMGAVDIATGDYLGNSNILRNGVNWLAGKSSTDEIVNVGIELSSSYIQMTQMQVKVWFAVLVIAVPLVILGVGVAVWIRRKNL